jgi:hypothetical protein
VLAQPRRGGHDVHADQRPCPAPACRRHRPAARAAAGPQPPQAGAVARCRRAALFAEQGYDHVTADGIGAEAGLPVGTFYNYFASKP